jgi:hypothetical protein
MNAMWVKFHIKPAWECKRYDEKSGPKLNKTILGREGIVAPENGTLASLANRAVCDKTWCYYRYYREYLGWLFPS